MVGAMKLERINLRDQNRTKKIWEAKITQLRNFEG